jgi:streptogramin lyase
MIGKTLGGLALVVALAACGDDDPQLDCSTQWGLACAERVDCTVPGVACTWAGLPGEEGFNGDGKDKLDTKLYWTLDMRFASDGTPWFIDWNNHLVRRVLPDGTVESMVGWIDPVFPGDGAPDESTPQGAVGTDVQLNHPTDLAELPDGTMLIMAWHNHKLRKIDPTSGRVSIICGRGAGFAGDGAAASTALFRQPKAVEVSEQGEIFILDQQNFRIRKIDAAGNMSTIAGNGMKGFSGDGGPALMAQFDFEAGSNPEPSGGLAIIGDKLYVTDTLQHRVRMVDLTLGTIDTIAGTGEAGAAGDGGQALDAQLNAPRDLEVGPDGHLYIADTDNSKIRAIDLTTGVIRTVAGTGTLGMDLAQEGLPATQMHLKRPFGIEFDADGNLYIMDTINSRIVKVTR